MKTCNINIHKMFQFPIQTTENVILDTKLPKIISANVPFLLYKPIVVFLHFNKFI